MYDRKLGLAEGADERVEILSEIADIHESGRADLPSAIVQHLQILQEVPASHDAHRRSLNALHRLYRQREDWSSLVGIIRQEIEAVATRDGAALLGLYRELGQVNLHQLGNIREAMEAYAAVLDRDPKDAVARTDLQSLLQDPDNALAACGILEPIFQAEENWSELVRVLRDPPRADRAHRRDGGGESQGAVGTAFVEIHAVRAREQRAAFEAATRLLALDRGRRGARAARGVCRRSSVRPAGQNLAQVYDDRLEALSAEELEGRDAKLAASYSFPARPDRRRRAE